jgi:hypothetical protein
MRARTLTFFWYQYNASPKQFFLITMMIGRCSFTCRTSTLELFEQLKPVVEQKAQVNKPKLMILFVKKIYVFEVNKTD